MTNKQLTACWRPEREGALHFEVTLSGTSQRLMLRHVRNLQLVLDLGQILTQVRLLGEH
ncbi:MAG: hypothetical protein JWM11_4155 [Planctomycetaceae bacterium]|nr:hypothetical protein [Planctomycetaceae bacterium]